VKPIGWGYDGGPNFLVSISESYGTPDQFKDLMNEIHKRQIKVGFDIQLNHFGPEGVYQDWYGPYIANQKTEWGSKPNFAQLIVRQFLLQKLKLFCDIYAPDYLRLDMSSRYGDDNFIKDLCQLVSPLSVVLEDERNNPWLTDHKGAGALARWSFTTVHNLIAIRHGDYSHIENTVDWILNHSHRSVSFANSHDEQGNNDGRPMTDLLTPAIAMLSNGVEMYWYAPAWFHFFCNYDDPINLIKVTAEKAPFLDQLPDDVWAKLYPLHRYFHSFKDCKEFFRFINHLWRTEVVPFLVSDPAKYRANIQVWTHNNSAILNICEAYNLAIYKLCATTEPFMDKAARKKLLAMKKIRKDNPWLYSDKLSENQVKCEGPVFTASRKNLDNGITITLNAELNKPQEVTFTCQKP